MFQIGASLREARERRGLSSADVQKAIRIRDRYLNALEEERWELLPGDAYLKGFLRTYADFLGLDGNLYVEEYNSRFSHGEDQALVPPALARRSSVARIAVSRPLVALALVALVAAALAVWQLHGRGESRQVGDTTTRQTTTRSHQHRHTQKHTKQRRVALPKQAILVASRGACWLEVRSGSATGALLYEGTLQQGQKRRVSLLRGSVWIDVGDPPNLDVRMGGRVMPGLPTQTGNVLLTRRGVQPAA